MTTFRSRLIAGVAATGLAAAGLAAASVPAPAAPAVPEQAQAPAKSSSQLRVMTVNLYLGSSLSPAINAALDPDGTLLDFLLGAAKVYDTAQKTDFPKRAKWIAKTVKELRPDVLSLNELTTWERSTGPEDKMPSYDFLEIFEDALAKQGLEYEVASRVFNANIGISKTIGIPYLNNDIEECSYDPTDPTTLILTACTVRMKDSDALMYNTESSGLQKKFFSDKQAKQKVGTFKSQVVIPVTDDVSLSFDRGYAAAKFSWQGKPVSILTSHLEVESQDGVGKPGKYGPKNWPSAVQVGQGKELLKKSKMFAKDTGGRVILLGDLNTDANGYYSPTYANLTKKYFKDSWKQVGKKFGKAKGATCCRSGALNTKKKVKGVKGPGKYMDSGDPVIPTRIDLALLRKATASNVGIAGVDVKSKRQPRWESDHNFYWADVTLK